MSDDRVELLITDGEQDLKGIWQMLADMPIPVKGEEVLIHYGYEMETRYAPTPAEAVRFVLEKFLAEDVANRWLAAGKEYRVALLRSDLDFPDCWNFEWLEEELVNRVASGEAILLQMVDFSRGASLPNLGTPARLMLTTTWYERPGEFPDFQRTDSSHVFKEVLFNIRRMSPEEVAEQDRRRSIIRHYQELKTLDQYQYLQSIDAPPHWEHHLGLFGGPSETLEMPSEMNKTPVLPEGTLQRMICKDAGVCKDCKAELQAGEGELKLDMKTYSLDRVCATCRIAATKNA